MRCTLPACGKPAHTIDEFGNLICADCHDQWEWVKTLPPRKPSRLRNFFLGKVDNRAEVR